MKLQKIWRIWTKNCEKFPIRGKEKRQLFWKWFFAIISRTVRARAKILVEINPLGHNHTPPHLFPAKNVIIIKFCHGSKIWSFFNENNSKNVGFCRKIDQISCFGPDVILSNKTHLYSQQILKFWESLWRSGRRVF